MDSKASMKRMVVSICPMDETNMHMIPHSDQPYEVYGKMILRLDETSWSYKEKLFDSTYTKFFSDEDLDLSEYLAAPDKIILMAFVDGVLAGTMRLSCAWNLYAFIDNIGVFADYRKKGIGTALMTAAEEWAVKQNLKGLALEMQDINLNAAHFYKACGFEIGGVNTMLYKNFEMDEIAVFWYKKII